MKWIIWVGNLIDLLFLFIMINVFFEDEREFYFLICFEEFGELYKVIFVFIFSYFEVKGN